MYLVAIKKIKTEEINIFEFKNKEDQDDYFESLKILLEDQVNEFELIKTIEE